MTREGAGRAAPAPSSRSPRGRVDVRAWAGGIRFSAFTVIMLGLVVLAVFTLVPTVGTYLGQRQQISSLTHSVQVSQADVASLQQQKDRWNDPAYVTSQARERLYYVRPGEVVYLVDNDLPKTAIPAEQGAVSAQVQETRVDWMTQLVRSVAGAGLAQTAAVPPAAPAG
ncbi:septum formation initiator family protein [Microbacterium sp. VKM Ac-2870]|uniref:FtsB family cell division protein n=1 Tax=Microbacterium sp. VKM Ac-2870 TaxID=2783825 RepID=UPI00188A112B|nr:septum formation initiator family protein [Microbacterium sp. VKM Ac-2870]MBF4563251.1 septum formation initiator family protein [Microbacterium sp. VKM Ac-2870]